MTDPCKGCVCYSCKLSEKQGDLYGCKLKRCKHCEAITGHYKLAYCPESIPIEEDGDVMKVW